MLRQLGGGPDAIEEVGGRMSRQRTTRDAFVIMKKHGGKDYEMFLYMGKLVFTKVFTRFNDGTTMEDNEVRTALVCGFTGKNRGGVAAQELREYTVIGDN